MVKEDKKEARKPGDDKEERTAAESHTSITVCWQY